MTRETIRLSLELVADSEPIKGSLSDARGEPRPFEGWMELAATLEAFIARGSHRTSASANADVQGR